jgi:hypothetical protein
MYKIILLGLFACLLTSCKKPPLDHDYLIQHPALLQKEVIKCQSIAAEDAYCIEITKAADDFSRFLSDYQNDPEEFGSQILFEEQELAMLKQKMNDAAGNQEVLIEAKAQYQLQLNKVRNLLAVVASIIIR